MKKKVVHCNPPKHCDICKKQIESFFVDGKTKFGPWANMCQVCYSANGIGIGTGLGQIYQKKNGVFEKVQG